MTFNSEPNPIHFITLWLQEFDDSIVFLINLISPSFPVFLSLSDEKALKIVLSKVTTRILPSYTLNWIKFHELNPNGWFRSSFRLAQFTHPSMAQFQSKVYYISVKNTWMNFISRYQYWDCCCRVFFLFKYPAELKLNSQKRIPFLSLSLCWTFDTLCERIDFDP